MTPLRQFRLIVTSLILLPTTCLNLGCTYRESSEINESYNVDTSENKKALFQFTYWLFYGDLQRDSIVFSQIDTASLRVGKISTNDSLNLRSLLEPSIQFPSENEEILPIKWSTQKQLFYQMASTLPKKKNLHEEFYALPKGSSVLAYSYPISIIRGDIAHINAFAKRIKNSRDFDTVEGKIKDTLRSMAFIEYCGNDTNKIIVVSKILNPYRSLSISLTDNTGAFKIDSIFGSGTKTIDSYDGTAWHWAITTKSNEKEVKLILNAMGLKPSGKVDGIINPTIPINVRLNEINMFRQIWGFLTNPDNFNFVLGGIGIALAGIIGFFANRYFNNTNNNNQNTGNPY